MFIPVIFFCYFADVTAVINEKRIFASVKDSFLRVANGSFSLAVFYLINIGASFVLSLVFAVFAGDALLPVASMTEAELLSLSQDELLALMSAPEVVFAGFAAFAVCAVFFVPLFTLYKVCFFSLEGRLLWFCRICLPVSRRASMMRRDAGISIRDGLPCYTLAQSLFFFSCNIYCI